VGGSAGSSRRLSETPSTEIVKGGERNKIRKEGSQKHERHTKAGKGEMSIKDEGRGKKRKKGRRKQPVS